MANDGGDDELLVIVSSVIACHSCCANRVDSISHLNLKLIDFRWLGQPSWEETLQISPLVNSTEAAPLESTLGRFRRHDFDLRLSHATCSSHDLRAIVAGFWNVFQNPTRWTFFELYATVLGKLWGWFTRSNSCRMDDVSKLCCLNRPLSFYPSK